MNEEKQCLDFYGEILKVGDEVWLIRETGGQRFIAFDRVYNPNTGCTTK